MIPVGINRFIVEINEVLSPNVIELYNREFYLNKKKTNIFNYPTQIRTLEKTYQIDLETHNALNFHGLSYILFILISRKVYLLENEEDPKLLHFNKWLKKVLLMEK